MKRLFSKDLILPLFVFLITFAFFLPNLINKKIPIPADAVLGLYHPWRDISLDGYNIGKFPVKNPLITDPVLQIFPWKKLVVDNFLDGRLPLWNPYSFSGQPLLANIQSSAFQINNILYVLLPFKVSWTIQIVLASILSSLFMFFFLKEIKCSSQASLFGAIVLPFSSFFVAWLEWGTVITTAMWLPLILLSMLKIFKKSNIIWYLILIFSISQTIFSGHSQTAFYVLLAAFIFLIIESNKKRSLKAAILTFSAFVLGVFISAVQILPSLEFINHSTRNLDQSYFAGREDWFIPVQNLIQIVSPDFFGNPTTNNYWGIWNYAEFVTFIGIIPLFFSIYVIFNKNTKAIYFLILAILSLILGLSNPISKIPYLLNIPIVSSMQPSRIIFLLTFSMVSLSAIGLDDFLKSNKIKKTFLPLILLSGTLIILILSTVFQKNLFPQDYNFNTYQVAFRNLILPTLTLASLYVIVTAKLIKINQKAIFIAVILVTVFELFRFAIKFTPFTKASLVFPHTESTNFLANKKKPFRIMTTDRRIVHPNLSSYYKIESIDGYDPLYLKNYAKFITVLEQNNPSARISSFNRIITPQNYDSKLINLLNVKYILSFDEIKKGSFEKVFEEGNTKIFKNNNFIPRAFFVKEVIKAQNENDAYKILLDKNFNLLSKATSQEVAVTTNDLNAEAKIEIYTDQSLTIRTSSNKQAPLIITNVYYPGWIAFIDGKKTEILKADTIFQMVLVPQGEHKIELKFQPKSFYNGLYISITSTIFAILISIYLWKKRYL